MDFSLILCGEKNFYRTVIKAKELPEHRLVLGEFSLLRFSLRLDVVFPFSYPVVQQGKRKRHSRKICAECRDAV